MTLYRQAILAESGNAFLCGGEVTPQAVAVFLWAISPEFKVGADEPRALFIARLRETDALDDLAACEGDISDYLDEMFLDAPTPGSGGGKGRSPITCPEARYVHIFAKTYSWSDDKTIHTALPKLHQLLRQITLDADPQARFINRRSDRIRGDYQRSLPAPVPTPVPQPYT